MIQAKLGACTRSTILRRAKQAAPDKFTAARMSRPLSLRLLAEISRRSRDNRHNHGIRHNRGTRRNHDNRRNHGIRRSHGNRHSRAKRP